MIESLRCGLRSKRCDPQLSIVIFMATTLGQETIFGSPMPIEDGVIGVQLILPLTLNIWNRQDTFMGSRVYDGLGWPV